MGAWSMARVCFCRFPPPSFYDKIRWKTATHRDPFVTVTAGSTWSDRSCVNVSGQHTSRNSMESSTCRRRCWLPSFRHGSWSRRRMAPPRHSSSPIDSLRCSAFQRTGGVEADRVPPRDCGASWKIRSERCSSRECDPLSTWSSTCSARRSGLSKSPAPTSRRRMAAGRCGPHLEGAKVLASSRCGRNDLSLRGAT